MTVTTRQPFPSHRTTNWGRWGDDDERGALNLLTPDVVRRAAQSITTGTVYGLGIPIQNHDIPTFDYRGTPMRLTLQDATDHGSVPGPEFGCPEGTGAHEDVMFFASHTASHMDALIHVYGEYSHYNGVGFGAMQAMAGATRLGIEKVGGFSARGVLLDAVAHFGDHPDWLDVGRTLTGDDLAAVAAAQGVEVRAGDVVLVRTGYLQYWWQHRPGPADYQQPGIGLDAADWLAERDVVAVGSDNAAVEVVPFDRDEFLGVHKRLLVDRGVYLLEFLDLSAPARDGNLEGLLSVGPLKVTGATGSPINPIFTT